MRRLHLAIPFLCLTACAVRQPAPRNWRLAGRTLVPPEVASPDLAEARFTARLSLRRNCLESDAVTVARHRSRITVTVHREALLRQPRGWLAAWIDRAETEGCLPAGQGMSFAARILESLPLPAGAAHGLMRADGRTNYVDLIAGNRLQVVTPILRPGSPVDTADRPMKVSGTDKSLVVEMEAPPDLIGFETALYDLQPKPAGRGSTIVPVSAQVHVDGKVEAKPGPAANLFRFPPDVGFYRLFYKADQSEILALAATRAGLTADPDSCDRPGGPVCFAIPRGVGVNPYMRIEVNGTPMTVAIGATVRSLLQGAKMSADAVLPTLTITKPFKGRPTPMEFDRTRQDILDLVLTGDEQIRWGT